MLPFTQLSLLRSSADRAHLSLPIVPIARLGASCVLELITLFQMERTGQTRGIAAGVEAAL